MSEFLSQEEVNNLLKGVETDYKDLWNDARATNAALHDELRDANSEIDRLRDILRRMIGGVK